MPKTTDKHHRNMHRLCIAPMMDWTDRHQRYFMRLITQHALLYTEMVHSHAILRGDRQRFLRFNPEEHPIAIQLGGDDPQALAECSAICEDWGYDEVNLNVGCPSDRVKSGHFGACLMAEPQRVADCIATMQSKVNIPVTVKSRTGIDDLDSYDHLYHFIETIAESGCQTFIIHARKAWLNGLSPKENREIPPLMYDRVYQIKEDFPTLDIVINGGIKTIDECQQHLQHVDGVMIGREAYQNPYSLVSADRVLFADLTHTDFPDKAPSRERIMERYCDYVEAQLAEGVPLKSMTRHILGLFNEQAGAKQWRRHLSTQAYQPGAGLDVLNDAINLLSDMRKRNEEYLSKINHE